MKVAAAICLVLGFLLAIVLLPVSQVGAQGQSPEESRIRQGFAIAPVPLDLQGKNRALVGLGSYIVNAQGGCNDCHTCPSYAPGHSPFEGGNGQINATNYLAGGVPFGPGLASADITPDPVTGLPENHTFEQFVTLMRTGHEIEDPGEILQVMPWPVYRNMVARDLRAIYAYLSALPHAEPGTCMFPGQ